MGLTKRMNCQRESVRILASLESQVSDQLSEDHRMAITHTEGIATPYSGFELGVRVRDLRAQRQMSMHDLASISGISQAQLSSIETGKSQDPRISTIRAIAAAFGLTLSELFQEIPVQQDDQLATLSNWFANDLNEFARETLLVMANQLRKKEE